LLGAVLATAAPAADYVPPGRDVIHLSFAPVVKRVAPAVVNVYSQRVIHSQFGPGALFNDRLFQRFFGDMAPSGMPPARIQNLPGSGVIGDPSGLIVTNRHVIEGADEIHVVLADRREFQARVILSDQRADLAVLRIDASGDQLPALTLGDGDALQVGDLVLAIGDPFGVGQTVTMGIVSGLARSIGTGDFGSLIQTDAAVNPGNSGGPLVDLDGRIVGINTAIFSQSGGSVGRPRHLAIALSLPPEVPPGDITRLGGLEPFSGATVANLNPAFDAELGIDDDETGVIVRQVAAGSIAEEIGIEPGDIVLAVNDADIDSVATLQREVRTREPWHVTLRRHGQRLAFAVGGER
jgi:S1-C subfamily serine protease